MLDSSSSSLLPRWLEALLEEKFFNACIIHEEAKKNEKNIFCLDCCESICRHCLPPHSSHRLLQIRRYVYHDVLRLSDAEKLVDCAYVQSYRTNSAKVVFLNRRSKARPCKGSGNVCPTCDRGLQEPYLFCSLYCKLRHLLRTDKDELSRCIFACESLTLTETGLDDGQMTPDSVLEPAGSLRTSSGSSGSGGAAGGMGCRTLGCTATTEIVRKKRSSLASFRAACRPIFVPVSGISVGLMNRRKGTPQRSPLH